MGGVDFCFCFCVMYEEAFLDRGEWFMEVVVSMTPGGIFYSPLSSVSIFPVSILVNGKWSFVVPTAMMGILERFNVAPVLQREIHSVSKLWETSIGPCRGLWLWFYPTLLRCSFIHSLVRLGLHVYFEVLSYRMGHAQFACNVHGRPFCCDLVLARRMGTW